MKHEEVALPKYVHIDATRSTMSHPVNPSLAGVANGLNSRITSAGWTATASSTRWRFALMTSMNCWRRSRPLSMSSVPARQRPQRGSPRQRRRQRRPPPPKIHSAV